ncbi:MAG: hypothetical protein ACLUOS_05600 [Odoribacter splanchnicus]
MVESQKLPEYNMDTMPLRRAYPYFNDCLCRTVLVGHWLLVGVIAP